MLIKTVLYLSVGEVCEKDGRYQVLLNSEPEGGLEPMAVVVYCDPHEFNDLIRPVEENDKLCMKVTLEPSPWKR